MSETAWKEQAIQLMALLDQEKRKTAELVEAMRGIEHFSDALDFRNDHLSKALREWIAAGSSLLSKLGLHDAEIASLSGWRLMPPEPTAEMLAAAKATTSAALTTAHATEIYLDMLAASPSAYRTTNPPALSE